MQPADLFLPPLRIPVPLPKRANLVAACTFTLVELCLILRACAKRQNGNEQEHAPPEQSFVSLHGLSPIRICISKVNAMVCQSPGALSPRKIKHFPSLLIWEAYMAVWQGSECRQSDSRYLRLSMCFPMLA